MTHSTQPYRALQASPGARERFGSSERQPPLYLRVLFGAFFIFNFPAFTLQLASDASGHYVGSPILAASTLLCEIFLVWAIASSSRCRALLARCWPIQAMVALMFVSAAWSISPNTTIQVSVRTLTSFLMGVALVGYFPGLKSIVFVIRVMVLGCLLSILWVFLFPEAAVHQASDPVQSVHAGLWRGIFSHKQGLGLFAGVALGLTAFYGRRAFPTMLVPVAIALPLICLVGSASATGFVTAIMEYAFLYAGAKISQAPFSRRSSLIGGFIAAMFIFLCGFHFGVFDFVIHNVLGKSSDLTGRADFWPIAIANFNSSGRSLLGGGFATNFAQDLSEWSIDNGYIDMLIYFGYATVPILFVVFAFILKYCIDYLRSCEPRQWWVGAFPFAIFTTILIANITESNFLSKHFCTVLTAMAVAIAFDKAEDLAPQGRKGRRGRF